MTKRSITKDLLKDEYPQDTIHNYVGVDDWVYGHRLSGADQSMSCKMMCTVLNKGYKLDIMTQDGYTFNNVDPNEVKIKLNYNCSVTPPQNGVIKWRVHSNAKSGTLNYKVEIKEGHVFLNNKNIIDNYIVPLNKFDLVQPKETRTNKYKRKIKTIEAYDFSGKPITIDVDVDVYDIINAFSPMGPALQHALKKVLCAGQRGHKDRLQDLKDIIASVQREIELEEGK